jgi:hypothetical protein
MPLGSMGEGHRHFRLVGTQPESNSMLNRPRGGQAEISWHASEAICKLTLLLLCFSNLHGLLYTIASLWGILKEGGEGLSIPEDGATVIATHVSERNRIIGCLPRQDRFSGTNSPGAKNISVNNGRVNNLDLFKCVTHCLSITVDVNVINLVYLNLRSTVSSHSSFKSRCQATVQQALLAHQP